ncbi:D-hexose-6-phosphate mutarotase [Acinetobacter variabilis]|uniref:D-hexose-6-phosphate mutarotase n=1 Tax=Acinetobacter variabilis TaxID=70346 RepID=UPI0030FC8E62
MSVVTIKKGEAEILHIRNDYCEAEISLQGAQVLKFFSKKLNKDLLWLSELNQYQQGKAIRGGIPLCFPWFGGHPTDANLPAHGFARNKVWQLKDITEEVTGHHVLLELTDSEATHRYWDYAFKLEMLIHCGEQLQLEFKLNNLDERSFEFTFAWHSYFPVETQIAQVKSLQGLSYIDQLDQNQQKVQKEDSIGFTSELDRIYPETSGKFTLFQNHSEQINIQSTAKSAVIWNPWIEKAKRLGDMHDDAWREFICVETGQIATQKVQLAAGQSISYQLRISA